MEISFKYQNKIYTTPDINKKLKRMKLSLEDVEIVEIPKKEELESTYEERRYFKDLVGNIFCFSMEKPISEIFKSLLWNPVDRTGVKKITKEYLETLIPCDKDGNLI